jgi:Baseplate J-like protein
MLPQARNLIDYTNKDYSSLREALLSLASERLPEWTDHSSNDPGVVLLELFAAMGDMLLYYQDRIAAESYLTTAVERRSVLNMLRLIGYELRPPTPASADLTLLFDPTSMGDVVVTAGASFTTTAEATGKPVSFQYVRPVDTTIKTSDLAEITYRGARYKAYKTMPVVQVDQTIFNETVGSSDGTSGQRFALGQKPMITSSLVLSVDEGGPTAEVWTRKDTLLYSQSADKHFMVQRDENDVAWIVFGDNNYGKAPRRGQDNIAASYLVGGGAKGNVPPMTISRVGTLPLPSSVTLKLVFNELSGSGGADAEPIADAAIRGPQQFRSMGRAVTAADYELHARAFGVAKARAVAPSWNLINLTVAPYGGGLPTDTLKEDIRAYFETKRMITTIVEVIDPTYIGVLIKGKVEVEPNYFNDQIEQRVRDTAAALWSFDNVGFQDILYISKLYEVIALIPGVAGVNITFFAREDEIPEPPLAPLPSEGRLVFGFNEIPFSAGFLELEVHGGRRRG